MKILVTVRQGMVYIKLKSICIFIISTIITTIGSNRCLPNAPFLCLPYEACCNYTQFCYSGQCESCFPDNVNSGNSSILFEWCQKFGQYNVALMKNETCRYACHDMFREKLNPPCPQERPFQCLPDQACCNYSEYCNAGKCESCFPDNLSTSLLDWCQTYGQYNATLMKKNTCQFACQERFTADELNPHDVAGTDWKTPFLSVIVIAIALAILNVALTYLSWEKIFHLFSACKKKNNAYNLAPVCGTPSGGDDFHSNRNKTDSSSDGESSHSNGTINDQQAINSNTNGINENAKGPSIQNNAQASGNSSAEPNNYGTISSSSTINDHQDQAHSAGRHFLTFETKSHSGTKSELCSLNPDLSKVQIEMEKLCKMPDGGPDKYNDTIKDKRYDKKDHQPEELVPLDFQAQPEVGPQETRN